MTVRFELKNNKKLNFIKNYNNKMCKLQTDIKKTLK